MCLSIKGDPFEKHKQNFINLQYFTKRCLVQMPLCYQPLSVHILKEFHPSSVILEMMWHNMEEQRNCSFMAYFSIVLANSR